MELHIDRDPLQKALARIQTVVERRNIKPILSHALLEAAGDMLTLTATDEEVSLRTTCAAEVDAEGSMAVNARTLFDIVRELPPSTVHLRAEANNRIRLTCDRARFDLAGLPADQFPEIQPTGDGERFPFEHSLLSEMLNKTHFAMSYDDSRFSLNGVFLQFSPAGEGSVEQVRMVATDTHRLAMVEKPIGHGMSETRELIIPKKAVHEIRRLLNEDSQPVELILGDTHMQCIKPEITLVSKLVQGRFPNFRRVIPQNNNLNLFIGRAALDSVVKRVSVLSHEKSRGIRLLVNGNVAKIFSNNPEQEAGEEEIQVSFDSDQEISIGLNARYLREILTAMEGEQVCLSLRDDQSPILLSDPEKKDAICVLMFMMV